MTDTPSHAGDAHGGSHTREYLIIFGVLTFLTGIEVFVPKVFTSPWEQTLKMLLLVGLAVSKAMFVAFYFMHLKRESRWTKWIAFTPVYMGFAAIILMLETVFRGPAST